jgi:hypothetical protein
MHNKSFSHTNTRSHTESCRNQSTFISEPKPELTDSEPITELCLRLRQEDKHLLLFPGRELILLLTKVFGWLGLCTLYPSLDFMLVVYKTPIYS